MLKQSSSLVHPIVAFMTDFGLGDGNIGVMKGIVLGIVPDAHTIDITHAISPQNVASAAWILATSYRYFPEGTVFVCVIDPGVGSSRQAIAVHAGHWFFVGPDNGLFSYVFAEQHIHEVVALSNSAYHLLQVSSTFHGRDIFSPVAAHIARGVALSELGPLVDPPTLQRIDVSFPTRQGSRIDAHVVHVDHFGNLVTNIPLSIVPDLFGSAQVQLTFPAQALVVTERRRFFSENSGDGEQNTRPFIYGDSSGYVGVAVYNGNAAKVLGVGYGTPITFVLVEQEVI